MLKKCQTNLAKVVFLASTLIGQNFCLKGPPEGCQTFARFYWEMPLLASCVLPGLQSLLQQLLEQGQQIGTVGGILRVERDDRAGVL
jgi:hypothetical protein